MTEKENLQGKWYFKGRNRLEYATKEDADKYGGGAIGRRFHTPIKQWEPIYDEIPSEVESNEVQVNVPSIIPPKEEIMVDTPQAVSDYSNFTPIQLRELLRTKGYAIRGNPSRDTMITKLKSLENVQ